MEVRVGGIYTLERLAGEALAGTQSADVTAEQTSDLYWTVMETLAAFVRERARWKEPKAADKSDYLPPPVTRSDKEQSTPEPATDTMRWIDRWRDSWDFVSSTARAHRNPHLLGYPPAESRLAGASVRLI